MSNEDYSWSDKFVVEPSEAMATQWKNKSRAREKSGLTGVAGDVGSGLADVPSAIGNLAIDIPVGAFDTAAQAFGNGEGIENDRGKRFLQNTAGGATRFGNRVGNIPRSINKYLEKRGLNENPVMSMLSSLLEGLSIPEKPREFGQNDSEFQKILKSIHLPGPNHSYAEDYGRRGHVRGDEFIEEGVSTGLAGLLGIPGLIGHAIGAERNPVTEAAVPKTVGKIIKTVKNPKQAASDFSKTVKEVAKTTGSVAKKLNPTNAVAGAVEKLTPEAYKTKAKSGENIERLEKEKIQTKENVRRESENAAEKYGKDLKRIIGEKQKSYDENVARFPKEEAANRKGAREALKTKYKELDQEFDQKYEDYYNTKINDKGQTLGKKTIESPFSEENIRPVYGKALDAMERSGFDTKKFLDLNKKATVKDYDKFRRSITRERLRAGRRSMNENISEADRTQARVDAENLKLLENDIDLTMQAGMKPAEYNALKKLHTEYGEIMKPFDTDNFLHEAAVVPFGNVTSSNIFESLNNIGADKLMQRMVQDPKVMASMARHDLMGLDLNNLKSVEKVLSGDFGKALPEQYRRGLQKHAEILHEEMITEKAQKKIQEGELKALINEPAMKQIFENRPDLLKPLENIQKEKARLTEITAELEKEGQTHKQAEAKVKKYNSAIAAVGGVAAAMGIIGKIF